MTEGLFDLHHGPPVWPDRPRYLLSFAYLNDDQVDLCRKYGVDLVMDSGAFTTAASGKQMDHDYYLEWLAANHDAVTFALSYDVIGDHEASRRNHEYAEDKIGDVVNMVPTFHLGSPLSEMERLCRAYDFVSVGGAVPFAKQQSHLLTVFKQIHRIAAEHGTKLHGLGMTGNRIIYGLPWWSVDSSAWLSPARFPSLPLAERDGKLVQMEHGWKLTRHEQDLCRTYGLDPSVMQTPGWSLKATVGQEVALQRRIQILRATARAYMQVEAAKTATHPDAPIRVYLSGDQGTPGGSVELIQYAWRMGSPYSHAIHPHLEKEVTA